MDLDLQPVLDIQPAEDTAAQTPGLDLQAATTFPRRAPLLNPTGPDSTTFGGTQGGGLRMNPGDWMRPAVAIPRIPQQTNPVLQVGAGAVNALASIPEFMESPVGIATLPLGGPVAAPIKRAAAGAFAAWMGTQVPELARQAGAASTTGNLQQEVESDVNLGGGVVLPALLGKGALASKRPTVTKTSQATPETFSEFGGETETAKTPSAPSLDLQPVEEAQTPPPSIQPEVPKAAPTPNVEEVLPPKGTESAKVAAPPALDLQPVPTPVPESVDTLNHQLDALRAGKKQAVLFTPGTEVPKWALDSEQWDTHETPAGTFIFDRAELTKDQIDEHVKNDTLGRILGYGIDAKPAPGTEIGAVTVRDSKGVEKQSVLTDNANLASVLKAAQKMAGEGDTVRLEDPAQVIADRIAAATPVVTPAMERARMAQENADAMRELAAIKQQRESEEQNANATRNIGSGGGQEHSGVPPRLDLQPHEEEVRQGAGEQTGGGGGDVHPAQIETQAPVAVLPRHLEEARDILSMERPPTIHDDIAGLVTSGPVKFGAADFGDTIRTTRDELANEKYGRDYGRLSGKQKGKVDRLHRMSTTEGMPADEVLTGLARENPKYADWTPDDLANAMSKVGTGKEDTVAVRQLAEDIARAEQAKPAPIEEEPVTDFDQAAAVTARDRVEGWLNDAIAASRQREVESYGTLSARLDLGLSEPAYRLALQIIREAYVRLRDLPAAIEEGMAWLRQNAQGYDESKVRQAFMDELRERATGQKVLAAPAISETTKQTINQYIYERRPHADAETVANGLLAHFGVDAAKELWRGAWPELPGDVRAKLIGAVARALRQQGDAEGEGRWWNEVLPKNTDMGQYISALDGITDASPEGYVAKVRQSLDSDAADKLDDVRNQTEQLRQALDTGRTEGIEAVRHDADVNTAARAAVDEHILNQADDVRSPIHQGVVMELAKPWSESPVILDAAREQVRAKANELLNKAPRPAGFTPAQHLRVILDDLAQRAAGIFAGHIQGSEPGLSIVDKLQQRLGLDKSHAQQLATRLSKEWDRQLDAAKKALPARLAKQRARQIAEAKAKPASTAEKILDEFAKSQSDTLAWGKQGVPDPVRIAVNEQLKTRALSDDAFASKLEGLKVDRATAGKLASVVRREIVIRDNLERIRKEGEWEKETVVDKSIRNELRNQNLKLGQILQQAAGDRTATGKHISDKIVESSGLTGEKADQLRDTLRQRYDELVKDAQTRRLDTLQRQAIAAAEKAGQPKPKLTKPMQRAFNKLVEIDRLAPVDGARFYEVVKAALKLPQLTKADAAALRKAVQAAQDQPAGFLRQRAMVDVMKLEGRIRGDVKLSNTAMGIFYANVLSGLTTFAKIPLENLNLFVGHTLLNYLTRPGELVHPAEYVKAVAGALKRGYAKGALQGLDTLRTGTVTGVWETPKTPGPLEMQPFGKRMEPLNFWKWFTRGIGTMHETTFKPAWEVKQTMIARDVARREGLAGEQLNKRVADLLADTESQWTSAQAQAVDELARVGNTSTLDLARRTREILEQRREEQLAGSTGTARDYAQRVAYLNPSYGFLGAVGDAVIGSIEKLRKEFPVLGGGVKSQIPFVKVATNIVNEKLNWTPIGLLRAGMSYKSGKLYGRAIMDPNERVEMLAKGITGTIALGGLWALRGHIHGAGPTNPQQERQLRETGWIPHSIELNGRYYSYDNTPLAFAAAVIGNAEDWSRYQKGGDDEALTRTAFALKGLSADVFSQGYLDSVGKFFEAVGNRNVGAGAGQMEKITARTAGSFVVPNLVNQVDKLFDPTLRATPDLQALLLQQMPFVRRLNQPVLNALGEPVESAPFHTWTSATQPDPLWLTLAQRQILVPEPAKNLQVGEKWNGPEFVRAITPDELYELTAISGPAIRRQLEEPQNFALLNSLNDADARKLVQRIAEEQRALALQKLNLR